MLIPLTPAEPGQVPEWALIELQGKVESLEEGTTVEQIGVLLQGTVSGAGSGRSRVVARLAISEFEKMWAPGLAAMRRTPLL